MRSELVACSPASCRLGAPCPAVSFAQAPAPRAVSALRQVRRRPAPPPPRRAAIDSPARLSGRQASATPAAYWGPAAPAAPKRKPNAVRRLFNRIGAFLGADEEMGTTPTYRDPSTGRTNTGGSKPYLKRLDQ